MSEEQFGFRKKSHTARVPLFVCFVDFKKAFDSVQHRLLWEKLHSLGISRQMIAILKSMYAKATARVKIAAQQVTAKIRGSDKGVNLVLYSSVSSSVDLKLN